MKEYDNNKIRISSYFLLSCISFLNATAKDCRKWKFP